MSAWFETTLESRSYEVDAFGHLNHAVYLNYFEVARIRALESAGYPVAELLEEGWGVHVVHIEVDYRKEAFMGELLRVRTRLDQVKRSSVAVRQEILRDGPSGTDLICEARVVWVWVSESGRPQRVPDEVRRALAKGPPNK